MTNYAAIDITRLRDASNGLLEVLSDAANGIGWNLSQTMVTVARPGFANCPAIAVWQDFITDAPQNLAADRCVHLPRVTLRYSLAQCIGVAGTVEDANWWGARVDLLDNVWGVTGGLYKAASDGTLKAAMGLTTSDGFTLGRSQRFDDANMFVWEGSVDVVLQVAEVAS